MPASTTFYRETLTIKLELQGETDVICTRTFRATPDAVFEAHINPDLLKQWMTGPDGWTMETCTTSPQPGGAFRMVWQGPGGEGVFEISGEYIALDRPNRIEHIERMHIPDATPDNHITTTFTPHDGGTQMVMVMRLPTREARDEMIAEGVEEGMAYSYERLDGALGC